MLDARRKDEFGEARTLALFLDLDGTLIDIAKRPELAKTPPGLVDLLLELSNRLDGAMAIVTGRAIATLDTLLAPARLRAAGVHGAEIRARAGGKVELLATPLERSFVKAVRELARLHPGVLVEPKTSAIAVHYRGAEAQAAELERRLRALIPLAGGAHDLRPGKKVMEVTPRNVSKGAALREFMRRPPFHGRRPIVIGDDFTDLSAFEAAKAFGGKGLRVAGEFFPAAEADFSSTAETRKWLRDLADRLAKEEEASARNEA